MTTECWIDSDYLKEIWPQLDHDKVVIRSEFDEETREQLQFHYKQIKILKQDGFQRMGKKTD